MPERVSAAPGTGRGSRGRRGPHRRPELGLKQREFDLAEQLGEVRTITTPAGRRVARAEVDAADGRQGIPGGAARPGAGGRHGGGGPDARHHPGSGSSVWRAAGFFAPVRFYVNRYRPWCGSIWRPNCEEFATREPDLLTAVATGVERLAGRRGGRAGQGWRARRIEQLLSRTRDPWARAGVLAAVLGPDELAVAVGDPYDRDHVRQLAPRRPGASRRGRGAQGDRQGADGGGPPGDPAVSRGARRRRAGGAPGPPRTAAGRRGGVASQLPHPAPGPVRGPAARPVAQAGGQALNHGGACRPGAEAQPLSVGFASGASGRNSPSCTTETSSRPCRS